MIDKMINNIPMNFKFYFVSYVHDSNMPEIVSFKFFIAGKDTCYWAGHYGA